MRISFKFFLPLLLVPACLQGSVQASTITCTHPLTSCGGTDDNVQFSGFSFPGFTPTVDDRITLTGNPDGTGSVVYEFNPDRTESFTGSFTYTVTLIPNSLFKYTFDDIGVNSDNGLGNSPLNTFNTSITSSGLASPATYSKSGSAQSTVVRRQFNPNLTSQTFTQSFTFTKGTGFPAIISVSNEWSTKSSPVPGPLPLLGAATAFGLSRKLRSRIRSAA